MSNCKLTWWMQGGPTGALTMRRAGNVQRKGCWPLQPSLRGDLRDGTALTQGRREDSVRDGEEGGEGQGAVAYCSVRSLYPPRSRMGLGVLSQSGRRRYVFQRHPSLAGGEGTPEAGRMHAGQQVRGSHQSPREIRWHGEQGLGSGRELSPLGGSLTAPADVRHRCGKERGRDVSWLRGCTRDSCWEGRPQRDHPSETRPGPWALA